MIRRFLCWLGWHDDETVKSTMLDKDGNRTAYVSYHTVCRCCGSYLFF